MATPDAEADWNHGWVFTFRDAAHRAAISARMAAATPAFDDSEEVARPREAYAETLRRPIATSDYDMSGDVFVPE